MRRITLQRDKFGHPCLFVSLKISTLLRACARFQIYFNRFPKSKSNSSALTSRLFEINHCKNNGERRTMTKSIVGINNTCDREITLERSSKFFSREYQTLWNFLGVVTIKNRHVLTMFETNLKNIMTGCSMQLKRKKVLYNWRAAREIIYSNACGNFYTEYYWNFMDIVKNTRILLMVIFQTWKCINVKVTSCLMQRGIQFKHLSEAFRKYYTYRETFWNFNLSQRVNIIISTPIYISVKFEKYLALERDWKSSLLLFLKKKKKKKKQNKTRRLKCHDVYQKFVKGRVKLLSPHVGISSELPAKFPA